MRRKDREITELDKIISFLDSCQTIRLGITDGEFPYIVPVSFGYEVDGKDITIYFHCAGKGKKLDILKKNKNVCVEADCFSGYLAVKDGITADYQSFIGFGKAYKCEKNEKVKGLDLLMKHCGFSGFAGGSCDLIDITEVIRIDLTEYSCKKMNIK